MDTPLITTQMLKEDALKGKVIVITGGGTGLGKSMCLSFLELGAVVVIASRKIDVLRKTAEELSSFPGRKVLPIQCDVSDYSQVEKMLTEAIDTFGDASGRPFTNDSPSIRPHG